jgi:AcrR family transcriptional regulator
MSKNSGCPLALTIGGAGRSMGHNQLPERGLDVKDTKSQPVGSSSTHISISSSRRRPHQERAKITVAAIVEAAGALLCEHGYAATTTNAIAKRAGVSIGSLYQYFRDKDEVFREVLAAHHREMAPIAEEAMVGLQQAQPVPTVIQDVLHKSLAIRRGNPRLMTALHEELSGLARKASPDAPAKPGWEILADVLAERDDAAQDDLGERAWLVMTILETVGRSLVHHRMPNLDEGVLLRLTRDVCADLLVAAS